MERLKVFRTIMEQEAYRILAFWKQYSPEPEGKGFYGRVDSYLQPQYDAPKLLVLGARLVWTFSAAYRILGEDRCKELAKRAFDYFLAHFIDREYGGAFWELSRDGSITMDEKRTYGEAFAVYALAEYYRTFGEERALREAVSTYRCLEQYAYDPVYKGYYEALTRQWQYDSQMQTSSINPHGAACKTMNTHLHLLEAYTGLYRVWKDRELKEKLREHVEVMIEKILDRDTGHYKLYFDHAWNSLSPEVSYGHDIEGSWLLWEAADVLEDESMKAYVLPVSMKMAEAVFLEGWHRDGGIVYEAGPQGILLDFRSWWVQAEAVVGFLNAWQLTGGEKYLDAVERVWEFIDREIVDHEKGGWFSYALSDQRSANRIDGWTCPYHNARMCFEVMERIQL